MSMNAKLSEMPTTRNEGEARGMNSFPEESRQDS